MRASRAMWWKPMICSGTLGTMSLLCVNLYDSCTPPTQHDTPIGEAFHNTDRAAGATGDPTLFGHILGELLTESRRHSRELQCGNASAPLPEGDIDASTGDGCPKRSRQEPEGAAAGARVGAGGMRAWMAVL